MTATGKTGASPLVFPPPKWYILYFSKVTILSDITTRITGYYTFTAMDSTSSEIPDKTPCPGCGGSGQTAYFGGESRFMLTWEDCPDCHGTGVLLREENPAPPDETTLPGK